MSLDKNIFFIETYGYLESATSASINNRQACSVESAALTNPNSNVYVIFTEQTTMEQSEIFDALRKYKNIFFLTLNVEEFSKGTITEQWITNFSIFIYHRKSFRLSSTHATFQV